MVEANTQPEVENPVEALVDEWPMLRQTQGLARFLSLSRDERDEVFLALSPKSQARLVHDLPEEQRRSFVRLLAPDDAVDFIQDAKPEWREGFLSLMDETTRREVKALLDYRADDAGGLMSPRFARLRPNATIAEALTYLRAQVSRVETIYYAYVLDDQQRLLGVVSLRQLIIAEPAKLVREVMTAPARSVAEDADRRDVADLIADEDLHALPVIDGEGRMVGVVTADDLVDVIREVDSAEIQKVGGMEALDDPYLETGFFAMLKKRGGWLVILFLGEMLTATAMGHFEEEIQKAVVLALFVPLIISSGGNSGSQATTLIIRAMGLGEVKLRDWWRIVMREVPTGLALGALLGVVGVIRILTWQYLAGTYGEHYMLVATTIGLSLIGVVGFGTLAGSMLPFILRRLGFDPASASAPFVATLVDVSGLIIYFSIAKVVMGGTML